MVAVCRMPQVEEASAAKLEELRLGAVSQGKEWLSRALYGIGRDSFESWLLRLVGDTIGQRLAACACATR